MKHCLKSMLALLMVLVLCLSLVACGGKQEEEITTVDNTSTVTFPEGYTITQMAQLLEDNQVCSAADFMTACQSIPSGYETLFEGVTTEGKVFVLEGYLFPDTYNFYKNSDAASVLKIILNNTASKVTADDLAKVQSLGYSLEQIMTLASIIQSECSVSSEMGHVSSVFWNRLNSNSFPYLGSDVTRQYIEVKMKDYISQSGLDYNTLFANYCTNDNYELKTSGLPIGPICNPGIEAIRAALSPDSTTDYYFFTDADNGFHYYDNYNSFLYDWNTKYKH